MKPVDQLLFLGIGQLLSVQDPDIVIVSHPCGIMVRGVQGGEASSGGIEIPRRHVDGSLF